jgi:hypothetical protein
MLIRDCNSYALNFCLYGYFKSIFGVPPHNLEPSDNAFHPSILFRKFLAGGLSGLIVWPTFFPIDTIKSTMMVH